MEGRRSEEDDTLTRRLFQVTDTRSGRRCIFKFEQYSDFEQRCKDKFGYQQDMDVIFELEDEQVELDESAFESLAHNAKLNIRTVQGRRPEEDGTHTRRFFQVMDEQSGRLGAIEFEEYSDFKKRCKEEFGYRDMHLKFELEDEQIELSVSDFELLANNTTIKMKAVHVRTPWTWSTPSIERLTSGLEYVRQELENKGKDKLKEILEEADKMSVAPLAIAVIGSSGQGKSKLINALRNVYPGEDGYAEVGVTETTTQCIAYQHPFYPNLVFWDLPGVGTMKYPRKTYTSVINVDRYDIFLICSSTRFTDDDTWLLNEVQTRKKNCFFLRTKVDIDIANSRGENVSNFIEEEVLEKIREYCRKNIPKECKLFLISSINKTKFDFQLFFTTLISDAPLEHQRSLTIGLVSISTEMIKQKAMYLKSEIWKCASLSAIGGVICIPGLSFAIDMALIASKVNDYQRQFELTNADIARYAKMINLPVSMFRKQAGLKLDFNLITSQGLSYLVKSIALDLTTEEAVRFVPVVGGVVAAGMSYRTTGNMLEKILNDCKEDAISVFTLATEKQTSV